MLHGRRATVMRAVAAITVATCCHFCQESFITKLSFDQDRQLSMSQWVCPASTESFVCVVRVSLIYTQCSSKNNPFDFWSSLKRILTDYWFPGKVGQKLPPTFARVVIRNQTDYWNTVLLELSSRGVQGGHGGLCLTDIWSSSPESADVKYESSLHDYTLTYKFPVSQGKLEKVGEFDWSGNAKLPGSQGKVGNCTSLDRKYASNWTSTW